MIYQDNNSDDLLITFAALDYDPKTDAFWGRYFAERAGFSGLGFVARRNNWYPERHMKAAAEAARATIGRYQRAITYGSSMGAYAAVKYSNLLGATACAAFGPQFSIDPADGVTSPAYTRFFEPGLHSGMGIRTEDVCPQPFVFFDPTERFDLEQVRSISRVAPETIEVAMPYTGHECIKVVAGVQNTRQILLQCLDNDVAGVRASCRRHRAGSAARKAGLAGALVARRPDLAFTIAEQGRDKMDPKQLALFYDSAAGSYIDKGAWIAAEDMARRALAIMPTRTSFIRRLATVFERSKRWNEALPLFLKYLELTPADATIHNVVAGIHLTLGDVDLADAAIARAVALPPPRVGVLRRLAAIRMAQGRAPEAQAALTSAAAVDPRDMHVDLDMAGVLENQGHLTAALDSARSALAKNPRHPAPIACVARLEGLLA